MLEVEADPHLVTNLRVSRWEISPDRMDLSYMQGCEVIRAEQARMNIERARIKPSG